MEARFVIRRARPDEVAAIIELWDRSDATPTPTDTSERVARLLACPTAALIVAAQGNRIIGTVIAGWDGWRGNIYRLAVQPENRHRGIATALVKAAVESLEANGAELISALVEHAHAPAVGFWDSLAEFGFLLDPRMIRYLR